MFSWLNLRFLNNALFIIFLECFHFFLFNPFLLWRFLSSLPRLFSLVIFFKSLCFFYLLFLLRSSFRFFFFLTVSLFFFILFFHFFKCQFLFLVLNVIIFWDQIFRVFIKIALVLQLFLVLDWYFIVVFIRISIEVTGFSLFFILLFLILIFELGIHEFIIQFMNLKVVLYYLIWFICVFFYTLNI